jgi:two-component system CheB/CheR fusion protein
LFANLPNDTGMAFVVVQHLSPDFESRMDELLGRQTALPIYPVHDGIEVRPNAVYLIPPRKDMIMSGGKLLLTDKDDVRGFSLPIDHFFRSLAHDVGRRAVAVVLSGAGSDGSRGIRDVRDAGGLVIAQTPDSAAFQGMPLAAKQSGAVDLYLRPEEMARALLRHVQELATVLEEPDSDRPPLGTPMDQIMRLLRSEYGIEFAYYKPSTVVRRIERRLGLTNQPDVNEYARALATNPDELNALYRDLLIGVTRFFRDPEAFERLEAEVIPGILQKVKPEDEVRVWVAGCATGEEPYSIAMLLHEQLEAARRPPNVRIFATDVHRSSLDVASAGLYEEESLERVSPIRRERYFTRDGYRWRVSKELRQMIVFARHNLITDAPFTRLDLVSCRNLLIYFQPAVQKKALSLFHFGLKTNGVLFLGPSETPADLADEFDAIDTHWKLFSKRRDARIADVRLPLSPFPMQTERSAAPGRPVPQLLQVYDQILDRVMPLSFLVDTQHQLVHSFGGAEKLLKIKPGRPSTNLLDMVDEQLRTALLGALQHAEKQQKPIRFSGVNLEVEGKAQEWMVMVEPLADGRATGHHFLIKLEPIGEMVKPSQPEEIDLHGQSRDYVSALETELRFTKETLQSTIEELETANEELQATNEELVASNEELQSTNEELHSVNEELYTVNVEHQRKITQLMELTADLDNLLHSIEVGVLFLDEQLCVRKFTAQTARIFRFLPQDVGRRFDSFSHTIQHASLELDVTSVLEHGEPIEREVTSRDGTIYLLRVLPYRSGGRPNGVVVTLIDLSVLKRTEARLRQFSAIVESSSDAILAKDTDGKIVSWNRGAEMLYGYAANEVIGRNASFMVPENKLQEEAELLAQLARGQKLEPFETVRLRKDGTPVDVSMTVSPLFDEHNRLVGASTIARDITQRKRDEAEVRRALKQRDQFMALLSHELRNPLAAMLHACTLLRLDEKGDPRKPLDALERQCRHVARLLDDLLDVSRMRQDGIELRKRRVDLRSTLQLVMEQVRPAADAAGVQIEVELPGEEVGVVADPDRMQQVEVNLLSNAVKYTPRGGKVWLRLAVEEERAVLTVEDDGIGIPREMVERIFEPFVRAIDDDQLVHGRPTQGMGLGLALVRSIVRAHGGEVIAESEGPGCGSRFRVKLPLAGAVHVEGAVVPEVGPQLRVVLVEDQDDSRELLTEVLQRSGFHVYSTRDGESAVEVIRNVRPSVALVDIGLPGINGNEVARRVRSDGNDRVFLVALTGYGQQHDREAILQAGFDQHLVKPVDTATLLEVLRSQRGLRARPTDAMG